MPDWLLGLARLSQTEGGEFPTLPPDGVPWFVPATPPLLLAVGDLHGDLEALVALLLETDLIDADGHWRGGVHHVVLLGDLVGGRAESRLLVEFVMRLEEEASRQGGAVHSLLGNHDVLPAQRRVAKFVREERRLYRRYRIEGAPSGKSRDAFRGQSRYAEWLRSRNTILKIGSTFFVHAGLDRWAKDTQPERINATVRAWIAFWQGVAPEPPKETLWTVGKVDMARGSRLEVGPLWNRTFKPGAKRKKEGVSRVELDEVLLKWGGERLVLGHAPVERGEVLLKHPYYGDKVTLVDTRLYEVGKGKLAALALQGGLPVEVRTKRSPTSAAIVDYEAARLAGKHAPPPRRGFWGR